MSSEVGLCGRWFLSWVTVYFSLARVEFAMKILTVVGARPQFVKAAAFAVALKNSANPAVTHVLAHTGQHYDEMMSEVFFRELEIDSADFNLGVSGGRHGQMTGRMLERLEELLLAEKPEWVLTYGDTNSTLAAALAASKLRIKVAHVEAGLRSFNMNMPEEINRIVADRLSHLLFCPTETAIANLEHEGIVNGVHYVGDVMYDVVLRYGEIASRRSDVLARLMLRSKGYALATVHRAENTDDPVRLEGLLRGLAGIGRQIPVVLPLHPRTKEKVRELKLEHLLSSITTIGPVSYFDMLVLEKNASVVVTDSGGVQKEAFFFSVPCITTRDETEWTETVEAGWNVLVGSDERKLAAAFDEIASRQPRVVHPYGRGNAADLILDVVLSA